MKRLADGPHVLVYQPGSCTLLPIEEWPLINQAIDLEHEWFRAVTLHGARWRVRLSSITDLAEMTQEVLDALKAEQDANPERRPWEEGD